MKAQTVATFLSEFGIPVGSYTEAERHREGQVDVNPELYIEITRDLYMEVHLQTAENEYTHFGAKTSLMDIVKDVQAALKSRDAGFRVPA